MNDPELPPLVVLLIDDEPLVLDLLQSALDDAGFGVVLAHNDDEAFAALEAEGARNFVGLITDVNLSSGRTGWDVAKRARQLRAALPVVYVTGDSEQDWTAKGVLSSLVVPKPFAPAQVVAALATLIDAPERRA